MNLTEVLLMQVNEGHRMLDAVIADVTPELLAWTPPSTTNAIGLTYMHAVGSEDGFIQRLFQGKPLLWESEGWGAKLGIAVPPRGWDNLKTIQLDLAVFRAYEQAVFAAANAYVSAVTPEELDRTVSFRGRDMKLGQVLAIMISHTTGHAGEIAALKGVQGAKGLPY